MRIFGRITVYGEYLMHGYNQGLIFPSNLWLDTVQTGETISHYSLEKDGVYMFLKKMGIRPNYTIYGNLPLGYGMAGSTALSLLHLSKIDDIELKKKIVNQIDKMIHGFIPSGLDFESCIRQEWGLYCNAYGWQSIRPLAIGYSLIKFPKENKLSLDEIQKRILSVKDYLEPIQNRLNNTIKMSGMIDYNSLMKYSKILLETEVYSKNVDLFISTLLKQGIIAKGIGGLYDKIILVVHSEDDRNYSELNKLVSYFSGELISNGIYNKQ